VNKSPQDPFFDVTIASVDGQPVQCLNKVQIQPHGSIEAIQQKDLLVIASATYIEQILQKSPNLVPWIRRQYDQGAHVASICTGVFLLAETGLLDGQSATLRWGFTETFRRRYPRVPLEVDRMFIDHGRLYCSAGVNAGLDLFLHWNAGSNRPPGTPLWAICSHGEWKPPSALWRTAAAPSMKSPIRSGMSIFPLVWPDPMPFV
jgi:transcriptional regulator GlxA family with amidase domain